MGKRKRDRWPDLCERVAEEDYLPCRETGAWTQEKLFTWNLYLEITSSAMADNPKWSGLVYVDLFGGPGVCQLKETKKRYPGSALLAAFAPKPFRSILVCEKDVALAEALKTRLEHAASGRGHVIVGDCNEKIGELVKKIPERALTLAFIDPEGLHVHFETLRILTANRQIDVAILLADGMDIVRNVDVYEKQAESNIDRFFGPDSDWRTEWRNLPNQNPENTCQLFGNIYKKQLEKLGFAEPNDKVFKSRSKAIYRIIYASKHPLGAKFWDAISKIDRGGQTTFDF
jgi:three-Cys-motif partner protein